MKISTAALAIGILALGLSACSGSQQRQRFSDGAINRALANAPGAAQPSAVVKAELEFARAVREQGQAAGFTQFAAPGAILHSANGPELAAGNRSDQGGFAVSTPWEPRTVWMSCSGALAVSQGRFTDGDGMVGTYIRVWQQQGDRSYKWIYGVSGLDDPQPPRRAPPPTPGPNDIVVTAIDSVAGLVADCPREGTNMPVAPAVTITDDASQGGRMSRDGTLRWRWEHGGPEQRRFIVDWLTSGRWQVGLDETLPVEPE